MFLGCNSLLNIYFHIYMIYYLRLEYISMFYRNIKCKYISFVKYGYYRLNCGNSYLYN